MPRVDITENARRQIKHSTKRRDEKSAVVVGAKLVVRLFDCAFQVVGILERRCVISQICYRCNHKERGRHAFARNVSYRDEQMIVVEFIKIVEIAADFLSGRHRREKVNALVDRKNFRQHAHLNSRRYFEFRGNAFAFGSDFRQIRHLRFKLVGHYVEILCQRLKFVIRFYIKLFFEIACRNFLNSGSQFIYRLEKFFCQEIACSDK